MGVNTTEPDSFMYKALLEVTSFFWASKGGRGILLEKLIASFGGQFSSNNQTLSELINAMSSKDNSRQSDLDQKQERLGWIIETEVGKLKFDVTNFVDDTLIILELKNRVDSGGTAARQEALTKLISICKIVEDGKKIFVRKSTKYNLEEVLSLLGIKSIKMHMGLLYNLYGKAATLEDDHFSNTSKKYLKQYADQNHLTAHVTFDENNLQLSIKKGNLLISVGMLYGNEVISQFSLKHLSLDILMERVFSKLWDDIRLVLNLLIPERAMLLECKKNHITEIKRLKENDAEFKTIYNQFCNKSSDPIVLRNIVNSIRSKADLSDIKSLSDDALLTRAIYAFRGILCRH